jgi:hypothetical protein
MNVNGHNHLLPNFCLLATLSNIHSHLTLLNMNINIFYRKRHIVKAFLLKYFNRKV